MSIPATEVEARWNAAAEPFTAVVREVRDWGAATPCEGWDALDLLDHVIAGQRDFAARQGREVPLFDGSRQQMATQWAKHAAALSAQRQNGDRDAVAIGERLPRHQNARAARPRAWRCWSQPITPVRSLCSMRSHLPGLVTMLAL